MVASGRVCAPFGCLELGRRHLRRFAPFWDFRVGCFFGVRCEGRAARRDREWGVMVASRWWREAGRRARRRSVVAATLCNAPPARRSPSPHVRAARQRAQAAPHLIHLVDHDEHVLVAEPAAHLGDRAALDRGDGLGCVEQKEHAVRLRSFNIEGVSFRSSVVVGCWCRVGCLGAFEEC